MIIPNIYIYIIYILYIIYIYIHINYMYIYITNIYIYICINLLHSAAPYCNQPPSSVKSSANPTRKAAQLYGPCNAAIGIIDEQRRGPRCWSSRCQPADFFKDRHRFCVYDGLIKNNTNVDKKQMLIKNQMLIKFGLKCHKSHIIKPHPATLLWYWISSFSDLKWSRAKIPSGHLI